MFHILPQILVNGLIAGALYSLMALGLALVYGILKFINLAHAEMAVLGAYAFYFTHTRFEWGLIPSIVITIIIVIALGLLIQYFTFKPIQHATSVTPMLASIGVAIFIQAALILFAGSDIKSYDRSGIKSYAFLDNLFIITNVQIAAIVTSILLMLGLFVYLKYAKTGQAIRAVADNFQLAAIVGIRPQVIITLIFTIGTGLAAISGIFIGNEFNLYPAIGISIIIKAFTAVIVGGVGNIPASIAGGFTIGILENLAIGLTPIPASYKDAVAFLLLILVLLFRPRGLFGTRAEEEVR